MEAMRVLMFTQKVDQDDDLLGVYHDWVKRLAEKVDQLIVICLYQGRFSLPQNVRVYSLGKEAGAGRLKYIYNFYFLNFQFRKDFDLVFVHMNTEYVLLGWWLWKLWRKKIVLWFAHYRPTWQLRFAEKVVDQIVTSVPEACNIKSKKVLAIGQGIDTTKFKYLNIESPRKSILFLGRISPVKNIGVLLDAFEEVASQDSDLTLTIVGSPTPADKGYFEKISSRIEKSPFSKRIFYREKIPHPETTAVYNQHELFINLTPTGSFDKTTLEAMASETPVIVSNRAYLRIFPLELHKKLIFREGDAIDLVRKIISFFSLPKEERRSIGESLRGIIAKNHNIDHLVDKLYSVFSSV